MSVRSNGGWNFNSSTQIVAVLNEMCHKKCNLITWISIKQTYQRVCRPRLKSPDLMDSIQFDWLFFFWSITWCVVIWSWPFHYILNCVAHQTWIFAWILHAFCAAFNSGVELKLKANYTWIAQHLWSLSDAICTYKMVMPRLLAGWHFCLSIWSLFPGTLEWRNSKPNSFRPNVKPSYKIISIDWKANKYHRIMKVKFHSAASRWEQKYLVYSTYTFSRYIYTIRFCNRSEAYVKRNGKVCLPENIFRWAWERCSTLKLQHTSRFVK